MRYGTGVGEGVGFGVAAASTMCEKAFADTSYFFIGSNSGFIGVILSAILGSITMMPTFVAFSLGNTLLLNGAGYSQVGALVSTLVLVGMMTYTLESQYIGKRAAFLRNFIGFLFSILAGILLGRIMVIL